MSAKGDMFGVRRFIATFDGPIYRLATSFVMANEGGCGGGNDEKNSGINPAGQSGDKSPHSLRSLHSAHAGPLLLMDSASANVQVGLLRAPSPTSASAHAPALWETQLAEAGSAVFSCTEKLLARSSLKLSDIASFVFCDGPGSVLGIRTAAVALRAWRVLRDRPIYSYCSLALVAHALRKTENARNLSLIADARRDTWHHVAIDEAGTISPLRRVPTNALAGALAMPEHFRNWTPLPPHVRTVPYSLETMLPALADAPLFSPAPAPDAFLHEEPVYQTWTPQVHQAG